MALKDYIIDKEEQNNASEEKLNITIEQNVPVKTKEKEKPWIRDGKVICDETLCGFGDCPKDCPISVKTDADILLAKGAEKEAIELYKAAVTLEPRFAEAWSNMASAYGIICDYKNAYDCFLKSYALDPSREKVVNGLIMVCGDLKKADEQKKWQAIYQELINKKLTAGNNKKQKEETKKEEPASFFEDEPIAKKEETPVKETVSKKKDDKTKVKEEPAKVKENKKEVEEKTVLQNNNEFVFCPYCGTKLVEGAKFCHKCGKKLSN